MLAASSATSAAAWCAPRIAVRDPGKVLAGAHRGAHRRWATRTRAAEPPEMLPDAGEILS